MATTTRCKGVFHCELLRFSPRLAQGNQHNRPYLSAQCRRSA